MDTKDKPQIPPGNRETSTIRTERKTTFILMGQQGENSRLTFPLGATTFLNVALNFWLLTSGTWSPCSNATQGLAGPALPFLPLSALALLPLGSLPVLEGPQTFYPPHTSLSQDSGSTWVQQQKKHPVQPGGAELSQTDHHASCELTGESSLWFGLNNKGWAIQGEQARKCKWETKQAAF